MSKPNYMKISTERGEVVGDKVKVAEDFIDRGVGLMFKGRMEDYDGLLIRPCRSIHTCFMQFEIDVVFLSKELEVVKVIENLKAWRFTRIYFKAHQVLELKGGTLRKRLNVGEKLRFIYV